MGHLCRAAPPGQRGSASKYGGWVLALLWYCTCVLLCAVLVLLHLLTCSHAPLLRRCSLCSAQGSFTLPTPARAPFYHLPEEEIARGPACWLWDYLRRWVRDPPAHPSGVWSWAQRWAWLARVCWQGVMTMPACWLFAACAGATWGLSH